MKVKKQLKEMAVCLNAPFKREPGDIEIKVPKVRDRSGAGIKFNSSLIPPYLKRTRNVKDSYLGYI